MAIAAAGVAVTLSTGALAAVMGDDGRIPAPAAEHPPSPASLAAARHAAHERAMRPSDNLTWPLHGKVTGRFGESRGGRPHEGIDIPMPSGTPIRAAASGRVVMREWQDGYGKYTCVAHRTLTTCYGHQSRFATKLRAEVRRGEVIGYVGNSGNSGAIHLHFEVRRGTRPWGKSMNPARFLPHR